MSRINLEDNLARRVRHASALFSTVQTILTGVYSIAKDGPQFHYLDPNGATRTVRLPPIEPGGGQLYIIANIGTGTLNITDFDGVAIGTAAPGSTNFIVSSKLAWFMTQMGATISVGGGNFFVFNDPINGLLAKPITGDFLPAAQNNALGAVKAKPIVPGQAIIGLDETGTFISGVVASGGREFLTANRVYFVRPNGSDTNTGLGNTDATAFKTIQKAIDVATGLDLSIWGVQINVAAPTPPATYTGGMVLKSYVGAGPISIVGNIASPQNVVIDLASGDCIQASAIRGQYNIAGFTLRTPTFGYAAIRANGGATLIQVQDIRWDVATFHVISDYGSQVFLTGSQTIVGDAYIHYQFTNKGIIQDIGKTITVVGPRTFGFFAYGENNGMLTTQGSTYSYSGVTGQRFSNTTLGLILTGGADPANYFPGSTPGSSWPGGYF